MFPTLGFFASVRCPDLSTSTPGGVCKRSPCLFSHTVAQPRTFAVNKRSVSASNSADGPASTSRGPEVTAKPVKKARVEFGPLADGLFSANDDEPQVKLENGHRKRAAAQGKPNATPTQTVPLKGASSLRKPTFSIGRDGKVVRKGPSAALRPPPALASSFSTSSAIKGKERAADQDSTAASTAPTYSASSIGPPRLPLNIKNSYFPIASRNTMLKSIFQEFMSLYSGIDSRSSAQRLASEHAMKQESVIYGKNNKVCCRRSR